LLQNYGNPSCPSAALLPPSPLANLAKTPEVDTTPCLILLCPFLACDIAYFLVKTNAGACGEYPMNQVSTPCCRYRERVLVSPFKRYRYAPWRSHIPYHSSHCERTPDPCVLATLTLSACWPGQTCPDYSPLGGSGAHLPYCRYGGDQPALCLQVGQPVSCGGTLRLGRQTRTGQGAKATWLRRCTRTTKTQ
jgi:hypothetical protein